jgi:hypothetical protein
MVVLRVYTKEPTEYSTGVLQYSVLSTILPSILVLLESSRVGYKCTTCTCALNIKFNF